APRAPVRRRCGRRVVTPFPVPDGHRRDVVGHAPRLVGLPGANDQPGSADHHHEGHGCSCEVARHLADAWRGVVGARHDAA
ncbi:MAG: hypothetical protein WCA57_09220, partial [Ilumatobacteraceae bacterium]